MERIKEYSQGLCINVKKAVEHIFGIRVEKAFLVSDKTTFYDCADYEDQSDCKRHAEEIVKELEAVNWTMLPNVDNSAVWVQFEGGNIVCIWNNKSGGIDRIEGWEELEMFDREYANNSPAPDWKEIIKKDDRYKDFTILEKPIKLKELFHMDIPVVQLHSTQIVGTMRQDGDFIVGFCGQFRFENGEVIPLDGDSYSKNPFVYGYSWFRAEGHEKNCLDILVGEDW